MMLVANFKFWLGCFMTTSPQETTGLSSFNLESLPPLNPKRWLELEDFYALGMITEIYSLREIAQNKVENGEKDLVFVLPPNTATNLYRNGNVGEEGKQVKDELNYAVQQLAGVSAKLLIPYTVGRGNNPAATSNYHWMLLIAEVKEGQLVAKPQVYDPPGDGKCGDHVVKKALQEMAITNAITRASGPRQIRSEIQKQIKSGQPLISFASDNCVATSDEAVVQEANHQVKVSKFEDSFDPEALHQELSNGGYGSEAQILFDSVYANSLLETNFDNNAALRRAVQALKGCGIFKETSSVVERSCREEAGLDSSNICSLSAAAGGG